MLLLLLYVIIDERGKIELDKKYKEQLNKESYLFNKLIFYGLNDNKEQFIQKKNVEKIFKLT